MQKQERTVENMKYHRFFAWVMVISLVLTMWTGYKHK